MKQMMMICYTNPPTYLGHLLHEVFVGSLHRLFLRTRLIEHSIDERTSLYSAVDTIAPCERDTATANPSLTSSAECSAAEMRCCASLTCRYTSLSPSLPLSLSLSLSLSAYLSTKSGDALLQHASLLFDADARGVLDVECLLRVGCLKPNIYVYTRSLNITSRRDRTFTSAAAIFSDASSNDCFSSAMDCKYINFEIGSALPYSHSRRTACSSRRSSPAPASLSPARRGDQTLLPATI